MLTKITKTDRADIFRERMRIAMAEQNTSQSALARSIGTDRSTISQLLNDDAARLPNAHIVGSCAAALRVSADWLLGLSERPESATDLLAAATALTEAPRALIDEQIFQWHRDAAGYKIRHVPAALPDMLKTPDLMKWEYEAHLGRTPDQAIGAAQDRLAWMRGSQSDYEIAFPMSELRSFVHGTGYYHTLPAKNRAAQCDHFAELYEQLFPRMRLFLFDSRQVFSAPITVFGPRLAVLYVGQYYASFRDVERVQAMTTQFDMLVKEAVIPDRGFNRCLAFLRKDADL